MLARLANQEIVTLRTATIDLKVDGISKSMEVFIVGEDTKHVLLGKDHLCVRSWIAGRSKQSEWVDDPVPLATITRAQSQALAAEEVANQIEDSKDGTCTSQLPLLKPNHMQNQYPNSEGRKIHNHQLHANPLTLCLILKSY